MSTITPESLRKEAEELNSRADRCDDLNRSAGAHYLRGQAAALRDIARRMEERTERLRVAIETDTWAGDERLGK